eukprot:382024-Prymnesium_polylepis.1
MPGYAHQAGDAEPASRGPCPPQGQGPGIEKTEIPLPGPRGPRNRPLISGRRRGGETAAGRIRRGKALW